MQHRGLRQRQVGGGGGYLDSSSSALVGCEAHPVGKDGRVPRVGGKLKWFAHSTPTDVQPDIVLAGSGGVGKQDAGGRMTRSCVQRTKTSSERRKVVSGQAPSDSDRRSRPTDGL